MYFYFNDTATTEIYTLSLHDALPIWIKFSELAQWLVVKFTCSSSVVQGSPVWILGTDLHTTRQAMLWWHPTRSEEHTSELQSRQYLVCRLLLEKKKLSTHSITLLLLY